MSHQRILPDRWLAYCLLTEADRLEEWWHVGWVVRNRVESARHPSTYWQVILQPQQFSWFNGLTADRSDEVAAFAEVEASPRFSGFGPRTVAAAEYVAGELITARRERAPFGSDVRHYWSPVSMRPQGSRPGWSQGARCFTPPGLDPWRFVFAEAVA